MHALARTTNTFSRRISFLPGATTLLPFGNSLPQYADDRIIKLYPAHEIDADSGRLTSTIISPL